MTDGYRTIVVDPPWDHGDGFAGGHSRSAVRVTAAEQRSLPYPTMTLDEIGNLPVADLADRDCRCFLWTTNRFLPAAFGVLERWGFAYKQTLVWHKTDVNIPAAVAPNSAEFVLVGTCGQPERKQTLPSAVLARPRDGGYTTKGHAQKPEMFLDYFEQVSPGPYLEMFSRRARFGWRTWGDEALHGTELVT